MCMHRPHGKRKGCPDPGNRTVYSECRCGSRRTMQVHLLEGLLEDELLCHDFVSGDDRERDAYEHYRTRDGERGCLRCQTDQYQGLMSEARGDGRIDDYPYGGGAGMVMQAEPVYRAYTDVDEQRIGASATAGLSDTSGQGTFTQQMAKELALEEDLVFLCGHYEGIDERVLDEIVTDYVSIGDYVLTGGELPCDGDSWIRFPAWYPGVLSNQESGQTESFSRTACWNIRSTAARRFGMTQRHLRCSCLDIMQMWNAGGGISLCTGR